MYKIHELRPLQAKPRSLTIYIYLQIQLSFQFVQHQAVFQMIDNI